MEDLTIFLVDRELTEKEKRVTDIFSVYRKKYQLTIFQPEAHDPRSRIQIQFESFHLIEKLEKLFRILIDYDECDPDDFRFDLTEITLEELYAILRKVFHPRISKLTDIEKQNNA